MKSRCWVIRYSDRWYYAGKKLFLHCISGAQTFLTVEAAEETAKELKKKRLLRRRILPSDWKHEIIECTIEEVVKEESTNEVL